MDGATFGLQSGFVLAVILGAVLFASRLGTADDVARRVFQVALGVVLAFAVVSGTTAFFRAPDVPESLQESFFDGGDENEEESYEYLEDVADRNTAATAVHAGAGVIALLLGLSQLRRLTTIPLGVAVGGLLLLLFGGVSGGGEGGDPATSFFAIYTTLIGSTVGQASMAIDVAHFVVLAGGLAALLVFGVAQWEQTREPQPVDVPED